jgi:hypothetical protein
MRRTRYRPEETYFTCPYCGQKWYGPRRARARGFSHPVKSIDDQDADVQTAYEQVGLRLEEHLQVNHRPEVIASRMAAIEREAKWSHEYATRNGEELDWATDPLAVEWRALMKEWWALPAVPDRAARLSPTYNRSLIGKGHVAPLTGGEKAMGWVEAQRRKLRKAA